MTRTHVGESSTRRVLYVEHTVDGTVGGSHYCLLDICRNLDRSRFHPVVLFFQDNPLLEEFRSAGSEVLVGNPVVPLVQGRGGHASSAADVLAARTRAALNATRLLLVRPVQWIWFLKKHRIDLVHLNNSFNGDHDLILAAWLSGIPCIAHQRGVPGTTGRSEAWFGRRLTAIIAISSFIRADLLGRGLPGDRIHLIYDGIDPDRVAMRDRPEELVASLDVVPGQPVVGVVGNIKSWKGQHVFVEAIAEVTAHYPSVVGLVVGAPVEPAYQQQLHTLVQEYGIEKNIAFVGYQRHPVDYMRIMDAVIHTSVEPEPFGIVIAEAMALGKPVIATRLGGPVDIVVEGVTGYLTCPGNSHELADRIRRLLSAPMLARRMGAEGLRRFVERFTAGRNVEQIQALYGKCVTGGAGEQS